VICCGGDAIDDVSLVLASSHCSGKLRREVGGAFRSRDASESKSFALSIVNI
jgi:hypothetical protein